MRATLLPILALLALPANAAASFRISMPTVGAPIVATTDGAHAGGGIEIDALKTGFRPAGFGVGQPSDLDPAYTSGDDPACVSERDGSGHPNGRIDCRGKPGAITITGSDANDSVQIYGGNGKSDAPPLDVTSIETHDGDDSIALYGLGSRGKIDGGPDQEGDTILATDLGHWTVNLDTGTAFSSDTGVAALSFTDFENVETNSAGGHTLTGDDGRNVLQAQDLTTLGDRDGIPGSEIDGRGGNDELDGSDGDDRITGGPGVDNIFCGDGTDTVVDAEAVDHIDASCEILNRLDVSLDGAVTDNDLFTIKLGLRNTAPAGGTPITDIAFPRGVLLREDGQVAGPLIFPFFGPTAPLPTALDPGASAETLYAFSVESPGSTLLHSVVEGKDNTGAKQTDRASLILDASIREPTRQEYEAMVAGGLIAIWDKGRQVRDHLVKQVVDTVLAKLHGNPKTRKLASPSVPEKEMARANGLPDKSLAWMSKRAGQLATAKGKPTAVEKTIAVLDGIGDGANEVVADAGKGIKDKYDFWHDFFTNPEDGHRAKIALELAHGVTEGATATKGYLKTAADFYKDPAQRKAAVEAWPQIVAEQEAKLNALDRAVSTKVIEWDDLMAKDPVKGGHQFGHLLGKIEGEVAKASLENTFGEAVASSAVKYAKARKAAGVAEKTREAGEAIVDGSSVAKAAKAGGNTLGYTDDQVGIFQSIAKQVGEKFGVNIEIQPRPINEFANKIKGALGKVEAVPTKNLTPDDVLLGAPSKWLGQTAYYEPKLPKGFAKLAKPVQERLKLRLAEKSEELAQFLGKAEDPTGKADKVRKALKETTEFTLGTSGKLEMKLAKTVDKSSGAILIEYEELAVNGRKVPIDGRAPIVSDSDINAVVDATTGKNLPAGIRGQVELTVMNELRKAADAGKLPFGYHGWTHSGFDLASKDYKNVLKYMLMYLPEDEAARVAAKYAKIYGVSPDSFLQGYTKGKFLLKITGSSVTIGTGASPLRSAFEPPFG